MPSTFERDAGAPSVCGDGIVSVTESCDRRNLNGASCVSLGYAGGGVLLCNAATCHYDVLMCRAVGVGESVPVPAFDAGWGDDAGWD